MAINIKLSSEATTKMDRIRSRLKLQNFDKLHILRIAFARSIQTEEILDTTLPNPPRNGFEIKLNTFEQKDGTLFTCLLQQKYQKHLNENSYEQLLHRHIEHGLTVLDHDTDMGRVGYEYLAKLAQKGMHDASIEISSEAIAKSKSISGFSDILKIRIGLNKADGNPYYVNFNKFDEHSNSHIGVVGTTGSGKTYFIKYLLSRLRETSDFKTNFVFFDYKGDVHGDKEFIDNTKAQVVRVMQTPLPLNIFRGQEKKTNSERIVDIVKSVEANIGRVQEDNLYKAIVSAYDAAAGTTYPYPDFQMVRDQMESINPRPDSLTSVFRPLTEHNLFASREDKLWDSLIDKTVIIDIHDLPACKDLCVFFVLNEIYQQLKNMGNSRENLESKTREIRTVIVIDEAHHFLKNKKRVGILESMIREVRSMGAAVVLLSQSPDDFDQSDFNFMELLEFVYVLGCTPNSGKFLKQYFGLSTDQANNLLREVTALRTGEAISRGVMKEIVRLDLCK